MFDFIIAAVASLVAGTLINFFSDVINKILKKENKNKISYSEKLANLTENLVKASKEVDSVLSELSKVAQDREKSVLQLEIELSKMEKKEKELKEQIEQLQKTPLPVAEHFAKLIASGEKRSAKRDYLLFAAGVLVTTIITIIIQVFSK